MGLEDGAEAQRPSSAPAGPGKRTDLPTGTVTFLFTDIEGSTRLSSAWAPAIRPCSSATRRSCGRRSSPAAASRSRPRATRSSSCFRRAAGGRAAAGAQRALAAEPWPAEVGELRVRMGLHTGEGDAGRRQLRRHRRPSGRPDRRGRARRPGRAVGRDARARRGGPAAGRRRCAISASTG